MRRYQEYETLWTLYNARVTPPEADAQLIKDALRAQGERKRKEYVICCYTPPPRTLIFFTSGYMNPLVAEGRSTDRIDGLNWYWPGFFDPVLDTVDSRRGVADDFVEDVIAYHHWDELLKIVVDEMSSRARQHKEALMIYAKSWAEGYGDHPTRIPMIKGAMMTIAGYMQLVYLTNDSIISLFAAYLDDALIFQGRK